ncbi:MAG: HAD-IA family hydrolase [Candidatus Korarchaeota archaeon]
MENHERTESEKRERIIKIAKDIRVVAFDMDGTLVDSVSYLWMLIQSLGRRFGIPNTQLLSTIRKLSHISESAGRGLLERTLYAIRSVPLPFPISFVFLLVLGPRYWREAPKHSKIYDISLLRKIPHLKLAIITNGYPHTVHKYGIQKNFDIIITRKDVKHLKPRPEPFLLLMKRTNSTPKEILVVDDLECNIYSAHAFGMYTAGIRNVFNSRESLIKAGADLVYDNVEMLAKDLFRAFY